MGKLTLMKKIREEIKKESGHINVSCMALTYYVANEHWNSVTNNVVPATQHMHLVFFLVFQISALTHKKKKKKEAHIPNKKKKKK